MNSSKLLHIAMLPWLAYGHIIPFLHLANALAKRGHKISFLLPNSARLKLASANLHPDLITFHALSVRGVEGLGAGAETMLDTDEVAALALARDGMQEQVKAVLEAEKPGLVIFDLVDWIPALAMEMGFKTVYFYVVNPTLAVYCWEIVTGDKEKAVVSNNNMKEIFRKIVLAASGSDALAVRACVEMEGSHCENLSVQYGKPVFCTGPLLPREEEEPAALLEDKIANWLEKFDPGSVVFCAFGSEAASEITQFQELVLGLELSGRPFLVASVKPPKGTASIQEAMPEGFQERVGEKGMLHLGWVSYTRILSHKSIGCCVSHGGTGSLWECLASDCQIVVAVPDMNRGDYCATASIMTQHLQVAVEVKRDENGRFSKEALCNAIKSAMDEDSKLGVLLKENHKKWRDMLLCPAFADNYIHKFIHSLYHILGH